MIVKSIKDLLTLVPDVAVQAAKGRVKKVGNYHTGQYKSGPNKGKPYSLQNIILANVEAGDQEIVAKFDGRDEVPVTWQGKIMHLLATSGGLIMTEETFRDEVSLVLKVTVKVEVTVGVSAAELAARSEPSKLPQDKLAGKPVTSPGSTPESLPPVKSEANPAKILPTQTAESSPVVQNAIPQTPSDVYAQAMREAKKHAARVANVWLMAYAAARNARTRLIRDIREDTTEPIFQDCITIICQQMLRDNVHVTMPVNDPTKPVEGGVK